MLYIGVDDDGNAGGLDRDGFASHDKFLLHLFDKVKTSMGDNAAARIDARIVLLDETAICRVECAKSQQPVFVKAKSEDEAFYVRTGPSSTKMSASQQADYISTRFA